MAIARATVPLTTPGAVYTSSGQSAISNVYFCNHSLGTVILDVYIVPPSGTASTDNIIYKSIGIPGNDTFVMDTEKLVFDNGDMLQASANAANAVTVTVSHVAI